MKDLRYWQELYRLAGLEYLPIGGGATNVSYASDDAILESLILHMLPDFGEHGDGILNSNMLTATLNMKGAKEVVEGGLEFWYGISKAESSNAKWQGKNDDMTAKSQDPSARLRFPPKVFTSSIVVNDLDKAMNKGKAMIKDFAKKTLREQGDTTIKNQFNSAFWNTSPGTNEPESIPNLISATPTTGTIGGLTRSGNTYLQNKVYTTAIADIGSEAGISEMEKLKIKASVGQSVVDIIIMDSNNFAGLVGYLSTLLRWRPSDRLAQLKIPSIQLGDTVIGYENLEVLGGANTITAGYMYGINSKFAKIKTLRDGNAIWGTEFERIGTSLNKAVFFKWFGNLVTNTPRAHFVATNVSTA